MKGRGGRKACLQNIHCHLGGKQLQDQYKKHITLGYSHFDELLAR
jgi:hypothetical protein